MNLPTPLSLTARLALLFALLTAGLLIVVGLLLGRAVEGHFRELDEHELAGKLRLIGNLLQRADTPEALEALPLRLDEAFVGHDQVAVLLRDGEGSVIYALQGGRFAPAQIRGAPLSGGAGLWEQGGHHYIGREAVFPAPAAAGPGAEPLRALLGLDVSHHIHFLDEVREGLWAAISASALAAALLGWLAAHKGLAPLRRVAATARRLSAERLGERLAESDSPAEVRELVEAFNGMLARLEDAFRRLSEFSADIAHELRTPVSNLMTQTEVALSRSRSAEEYREVLASNLEEFERIARMVSDMLFLAQADKGRLPRPGEVVALADEARALADFYEALAEEQGVAIAVSGEASVTGDRLMLRRAVSNLLSNALRHTPRGGTVAIEIGETGKEATLAVSNPGEAIPAEELSRIFERFHRVGADRRRHGEGAGLGLAITRSIVEAHGGRVSVASRPGTTSFTLHLPCQQIGEL
jgi:two-component system, OmpR family, heavy metal sensor histidine kinase CusS